MSWAAILFDPYNLLLVLVVFMPLEHLVPLHRDQKRFRKQFWTDVIYMLVNSIPLTIGLVFTVGLVLLASRTVFPNGLVPIVAELPLWLQVVLATIIADIGFYIAHRACHSVEFLWRFHAIHHSIEEMDCLAAHRVHPLDQTFVKGLSLLLILPIGFTPEALVIYGTIYQLQALLIHSNVRIEFGPLKWLIASPRFHHWHHANEDDAHNKNFAGQLPFIDWIAGTLNMPDRMPSKYGIDERLPDTYLGHLMYPFAQDERSRAEAAARAAPEAPCGETAVR
ncbi:MAG: sterol desaturase family protein [Hyphomicrobiaceae bacterium]|nr:sterol desaturase family protein [Hyphomicrobiaceae bacterium]